MGATVEEAKDHIRQRLEATKMRMGDGLGSIRIHVNGDKSIDGEFSRDKVRGEPTYEPSDRSSHSPGSSLLARLRIAWNTQIAFGRRYWISVVFRFVADTDSEVYRKWRGMTEVATHYRRGIRDKMEAAFNASDDIGEQLETKFRRKVSIVMIRCHWNPHDSKPQR